jgi:hypothetical protein
MFVVDKVVEEDRHMLLANDLCLLGNGECPQFLQLEYLHKTFALELIEGVLTNYHELFRKVYLLPLYPSETCMPAVILKPLSCAHSTPKS